ncbi:hypothetical protein JI58_08245 [Marinosulfonomonas sp. PRT-SC04]|nr:hypothetical protein JI58_08245 [Marinosulfonomonas sp. PRT-SC04]
MFGVLSAFGVGLPNVDLIGMPTNGVLEHKLCETGLITMPSLITMQGRASHVVVATGPERSGPGDC